MKLLNHPNTTCGLPESNEYCITDLKSIENLPEILDTNVDHRFYLGFNNIAQNGRDFFSKDNYRHFMSKPFL